MEKLYWSMVGKHFPESLEIQLTCAELDQRIAWELPSYLLRDRIKKTLIAYMEKNPESSTKQKRTIRYVERDLKNCPFHQENPFTVTFETLDEEKYTLDLKTEEITVTQELTEKDTPLSATMFQRRGMLERQMIVRTASGEDQWEIAYEDVLPRDRTIVTSMLFQLSPIERQILMHHAALMSRQLTRVSNEIEGLREKLSATIGVELKLMESNVLDISRELDEKIVEFIRLQNKQ